MKKARPEALSGYIFVIFHLKVCWGWYCVTGDMRKDWPRCIPNRSKIEEKTGPAESKHIFQIWLWNGIWNLFETEFGAIWDNGEMRKHWPRLVKTHFVRSGSGMGSGAF